MWNLNGNTEMIPHDEHPQEWSSKENAAKVTQGKMDC